MTRLVHDITGQRFNRWKVLRRDGSLRGLDAWLCKCDCGTVQRVTSHDLRTGGSAGCLHCRKQPKMSITVGKRTLSVAEWADKTGISSNTIYHRIKAGKTGKEVIAPIGQPAVPDSEVHADMLKIRQAFRKSGLTTTELAERLGCSHKNVQGSLSTRRKFQRATLERYAKALKVKQ
jgi:hypothetical protein